MSRKWFGKTIILERNLHQRRYNSRRTLRKILKKIHFDRTWFPFSSQADKFRDRLACLMLTYPSTYGVFEDKVTDDIPP